LFFEAAGAEVEISLSLQSSNRNQVKLAQIYEAHCTNFDYSQSQVEMANATEKNAIAKEYFSKHKFSELTPIYTQMKRGCGLGIFYWTVAVLKSIKLASRNLPFKVQKLGH